MHTTLFAEVLHYVTEYGYLAVALGLLLENFGLPTPGESLLIAGGIAASKGVLDIRWLLLISWLAASAGNTIGFYIGRTGGHLFLVRYGSRIGITRERLDKVDAFFDRYGDVVIIAARFFLGLRQFSGIAAGALEMPWPRFMLYNLLGAALWVGFWGLLSYRLGKHVESILGAISRYEPLFALGIVALLAIAIFFRLRYNRRRRGQ